MTDVSADGLEAYRQAFDKEPVTPLTDHERQIRRQAAGFALNAMGFRVWANSGIDLAEDQIKAAGAFRSVKIEDRPFMDTALGETIPIQLQLTQNLSDLDEEMKKSLKSIIDDPTGVLVMEEAVGRYENEASVAVKKSTGKKDEAIMLLRLLKQKAEGLPDKPIDISGDVDEETALTSGLTDGFAHVFGIDTSPQARATNQGMREIREKTGYAIEGEELVIPELKKAELARRDLAHYKEAVDYFLSRWAV
jgi:hypothetical protein